MVKQKVMNIIYSLPDDISMEEIMYQLYILDKHNKALSDIENGRVYSSEEIKSAIVRSV